SHRVPRPPRIAALLLMSGSSGGCFHRSTVLKRNGDGGGTIEHSMLFTAAALAQLRQLTMLGGGNGQNMDPLSEQQARDMAGVIGQGVTYVSSKPIATPIGQGRESIYAFRDVNQLKISTQPPPPGGITVKTPGISTEGETVTFGLTHEPTGNAALHIHVPEPNCVGACVSANASG